MRRALAALPRVTAEHAGDSAAQGRAVARRARCLRRKRRLVAGASQRCGGRPHANAGGSELALRRGALRGVHSPSPSSTYVEAEEEEGTWIHSKVYSSKGAYLCDMVEQSSRAAHDLVPSFA